MVQGVSVVWLPVTDMERALAFYGETLGLEQVRNEGEWAELKANGLHIGLNAGEEETPGGEGGAVLAFQPEGGIDEAVGELKDKGVDFAGDVADVPVGPDRRLPRPGRQRAAALRAPELLRAGRRLARLECAARAAVAQLARASACHAEGREFESLQPLRTKPPPVAGVSSSRGAASPFSRR